MEELKQAAQDPKTPQHRLAALANTKDPELCALLAQNPNLAPLTLLSLAQDFPREVAHNPSLSLGLLEDPRLIQSIDREAAFAFALCEETPEWLLELLLEHPQRELALLISHRRTLSAGFLMRLADSPSCAQNLITHPNCTEALWLKLAAKRDKLFIARAAGLPRAAQERLAQDPDPQIQLALRLRETPATKSATPPLSYYGSTHVGMTRAYNEDAFGAYHGESLALFVVSDGMGGVSSGDLASQTIRDTLLAHVKDREPHAVNAQELLHHGLLRSYQALTEMIQKSTYPFLAKGGKLLSMHGLGAAMVALLLQGHAATIAHIGDCRAYLYRAQRLSLLTEDHRLINEFKKQNYPATPEQLKQYKNIITRCLGLDMPSASPDLTQLTTRPGDLLLLCSDGLTDMLQDETIEGLLREGGTPQEMTERLITRANEAGGKDNLTVLVVALL